VSLFTICDLIGTLAALKEESGVGRLCVTKNSNNNCLMTSVSLAGQAQLYEKKIKQQLIEGSSELREMQLY
jgi:hypothetical protein